MERLPSDIVLDIFSRLPVESVLDCKLVSKKLLSLLRREMFAKMHHHRQLLQIADSHEVDAAAAASSTVKKGLLFSLRKFGQKSADLYYEDKCGDEINIHGKFCYKKLKVSNICCPHTGVNPTKLFNFLVGSCNGLICFHLYVYEPHKVVCVCNPITGEYAVLPEYDSCHYRFGVVGFGYIVHSATNYEYKVVSYYSKDRMNGVVQVYTIGSGRGWKTKSTAYYNLESLKPVGVFTNGALHWRQGKDIVAFSLEDEEFRLIKSVPCRSGDFELQALGGKLCLYQDRDSEDRLVIWSLQRNGIKESWTRDFNIAYGSINLPRGMRPLIVTKKNEVLLLDGGSSLCCYDPKTTSVMRLCHLDHMRSTMMYSAFPHMNSFISLKALGEDSKMQKRDIKAA